MKRWFLPLFFTALAVVFAIAVWLRLDAYSDDTTLVGTEAGQSAAQSATGPAEYARVSNPAGAMDAPSDPGRIEELTSTTGTASASARQQRYEELLRAGGPPAPPIPPQAPKESLVDRVMNPIANVLGIQRAKPPVTVAAAPAVHAPEQVEAPVPKPEGGEAPRDDKKSRDEQDPDTDTTAPHLLGAMFMPAQVQDDAETTLTVTVSDNLSGVRSVSGVIASPSGALQGFACQRQGQTEQFSSRIRVPKDAAEGVWSVKYLTLTDNANNSVNLNQAAGSLPPSASFRVVSSAPDAAAPLLKSVYLERRSMNAGERNTVFVQAEDDKSGVSLVSGVFVSPSKQARIGFGCRPGAGGAWECTVSPPACLDCGAWQLEQIQLQDKANNMATFRGDNQLVSQIALDIAGDSCDAGPPTIRALSLDPPVVSNAEGGTIQISAIVADDSCGVASLSGQAVPAQGAGGQRIYFSFDPSPDGTNFLGRITVPRHAAKGLWTIGWIQALDKGHNLKAYSAQDPVLARVTFNVE